MNKKLLSHYELAQYLSIGRNKAFDLMHTDGFPIVRLGRRIFANKEHVDQWIDKQTNLKEESK